MLRDWRFGKNGGDRTAWCMACSLVIGLGILKPTDWNATSPITAVSQLVARIKEERPGRNLQEGHSSSIDMIVALVMFLTVETH
jgi:hypothetical protein